MNNSDMFGSSDELLTEIVKFVTQAEGLSFVEEQMTDYFSIRQDTDEKQITINKFDVEDVLTRIDEDGKNFLQVNFVSGKKILITQKLVGFRPLTLFGLDMEKLPKVVTTSDIMNIFDAIQESLCHEDASPEELEVLRKVFDAVVCGGESVGFNMSDERRLFSRIPTQVLPRSA